MESDSPEAATTIEQTRKMADLSRTIEGVIENAMRLGMSQKDVARVLGSMASILADSSDK